MSRVLVISPDAVPVGGTHAAGPGIRYYQLSLALAGRGHDVTLAAPADSLKAVAAPVAVTGWTLEGIPALAESHDCVVMPQVNSALSTLYPERVRPDLPTAVDLYDPVLIENLGLQPADGDGVRSFANYLAGVVPILKRGDFFFCANERQRLYYLGALNVLGRINPLTYEESLIELVPFGVNKEPPAHDKRVMRGVLVPENAKIILWFSGIYPWFDALTLVEAMPAVLERLQDAYLVVLGGVHPRGHAPDSEYRATLAAAERLGLKGERIIFADWQPYEERANWYLEADLAVTLHKRTLETELSHRTRVIDFMWAGLPTIVSAGDEVGSMLRAAGSGAVVPVGDREHLAAALTELLADDERRAAMAVAARGLAAELAWDKIIEPLASFCAQPRIARDRADAVARETVLAAVGPLGERTGEPPPAPGVIDRARSRFQAEGWPGLVRGMGRSVGRRLGGGPRL